MIDKIDVEVFDDEDQEDEESCSQSVQINPQSAQRGNGSVQPHLN
jgi:hypothetical protein